MKKARAYIHNADFFNFKLNIIFVDNRIDDEVELSEPQAKGKKYALCLDHSVLFPRK